MTTLEEAMTAARKVIAERKVDALRVQLAEDGRYCIVADERAVMCFDDEDTAERVLGQMVKSRHARRPRKPRKPSKKSLPSGEAEGGIHVHGLERENDQTKLDGRHMHVFATPLEDGGVEFFVTAEDGAHFHALAAEDAQRTQVDGKHTHQIILGDGEVLETGDTTSEHDHDLAVSHTGFDGTHAHSLAAPGGEIVSLNPAQFWDLIGRPEQTPNDSAPAASDLAKAEHDALDAIVGFINEPDMAMLADLEEGALRSVDIRMHAFFQSEFSNDEEEAMGVTRQQVADAHALVMLEMLDRGIAHDTEDSLTDLAQDTVKRLSKLAKREVRFTKQDDTEDERFVFGVVLVPDEVDAQQDTYTAEEIRKAAHSFMEFFGGRVKLMHQGSPVEGIKVLETYLTKVEETHAGETFPIGTWLLAVRVVDDDLWQMVQTGAFQGFSIGGTAVKEPIAA